VHAIHLLSHLHKPKRVPTCMQSTEGNRKERIQRACCMQNAPITSLINEMRLIWLPF
jgi:hypothetical protein